MLKIIIPLAGSSEIFHKAGFPYPKPLVEIKGKPMIEWVIEKTSSITIPNQIVFVIKDEDATKYHLDNTLKLLSPNCEIVKIKNETKGGLCSVLMTIDKIDNDDSILILNSDQIIQKDLSEFNSYWLDKKADVGVVTFKSVHPRWSYILTDGENVIQTAEKNPISNRAIAGYYYFNSAKLFFECAFQTIINDVQSDGMFFISPVINEFILRNKKVNFYEIENKDYHSFYSPKLITEFENYN
ncbi:glycosyltransferase family 2 protein [Flavobacterium johnsoniae]|jgi:dTDP-glucose pyrophosphorylase|uniref:Nucleotidyl transferase n=1 Tax=Flavobacterium johnsoniae (strain ATCC 17061 / DSM 2064 / JCM 8514 / BCRC 14874 / CCUG 350202 / NBRC 14942 / NCIMB 11054 / UW101) TaxID=376686 RepID=A5FN27_FLAJ1|nr:glycosyltransferase family 2 protein [Flavobacterium johnsoniae]ABQ03385.1 Nucleotidyl transferase [Flavobacterium johnsoniae UW101]OXG01200.1 nucleotidyl transferase [Flavobacterium johnsoniae UW101]WQG79750.1 glycosyltransferase family 2 protein [Flavobacterium johnsoniae UW101]SHL76775.1 dTDP-glucose pyrophosphorylase [Flavobacterium johnsoniae]